VFEGRAIICLSGCDWDFSWQPTQEVMQRLACAGNHVLFVEPTGTRTIRLGDWRRVVRRLGKKSGVLGSSRNRPQDLTIYAPVIVPFPHSRLARSINRRVLLRAIRNWLNAAGCREFILWIFFPSPLNLEILRHLRVAASVYQYMSSAEAACPHPDIEAANTALLSECDIVFANSLRLRDHARKYCSRVYLTRAGVNLETFDAPPDPVSKQFHALDSLKSPVIGYIGTIHQWIDLSLLRQVAEALPAHTFVMVGPVAVDISDLLAVPNIRWVGQQAHHDLPSFIRRFDVCIIPYVVDRYTESAFPAKLNEYLAMGKPVVAVAIPEIRDFNAEYCDAVFLADDAASFIGAIRRALKEPTEATRARYREIAEHNSWAARVEQMAQLVEDRLRDLRVL
jgi:glycosyltransferase involved in cell wall biosynthesis